MGAARVDSSALLRLLKANLRPHGRFLTAIVMLQVFQTLALLYLPTLYADIIDNGVIRADTGYIGRVGLLMVVVTLLQGAATTGAVYLSARVAMAVGRDLREMIFLQVQRFSAQEMERIGVPSLITRTSNDVQQVQMLVLATLTTVVIAPVMAVGGVALALTQDVPLALVLAALMPALGIIVAVLIGRMRPLSMAMQVRIDAINRVLREQITGIRVTRAFVKQEFERQRFERANTELTDVSVRLGRVTLLLLPLVVNTVNLFGVALVWIGGFRVESGAMQVGALIAFLTYVVIVQGAVLSATFVIMGLVRAEVCAARIDEVLRTRPSIAAPANPVTRLCSPGHVDLTGVHFRYPGAQEDVLHDVDFVARPGTTTAIVGSTGSGKTTLLALICRLLDATAGQVRVGGEDVCSLDPVVLSRSLALVPQKPYLFTGTVASNLRYGNPDATDDELWRALEIAQAWEFVAQLDGQLEATVAQGGANLSGGQRQRLAIARALVRRPHVYLFDDAFSALDYATDAALREALARETADATTIVVAQRVSTIRHADRIVLLDEGKVAGVGTHDELVRQNTIYREIVRFQLEEE